MLATANKGKKLGEVLEKNAGEWTGRVQHIKDCLEEEAAKVVSDALGIPFDLWRQV